MHPDSVIDELRASWCESFEVVELPSNELLIRTPFTEPDGDELTVVVIPVVDGWEISDRGNTAAHLALVEYEFTRARSERLERIVTRAGMTLRGGSEVVRRLNGALSVDEVADFLQVLSQVRGLTAFEADREVEYFVSTGKREVSEWIPEEFRETNWPHEADDDRAFTVDLHIEELESFDGMNLFFVGSAEKADRSANVLTQLREWGTKSYFAAVVQGPDDRERGPESKSLVRLRSRFGSENIVTATMDQWDGVFTYLEDHGAPVIRVADSPL